MHEVSFELMNSHFKRARDIMAALFPSLMAADLLDLRNEIKRLEPFCQGFHLDIMDFHFVPNITFGFDAVNAVRKVTKKKLWVDLLVDYPQLIFDLISLQAGDIVMIHAECKGVSSNPAVIAESAARLHEKKQLLALALNPQTPTKLFASVLEVIDVFVLMGVQPGFSGQPFSHKTIAKLEEVHALVRKTHRPVLIGVDGGVDETTYPQLARIGVDLVALGAGVFRRGDPVKALKWYVQ